MEEEICHSKLFDKVFTVSDTALNLFYEEEVKKFYYLMLNANYILLEVG